MTADSGLSRIERFTLLLEHEWPRILRRAPTYDRDLRSAEHTIPLVRLVAVEPGTTD